MSVKVKLGMKWAITIILPLIALLIPISETYTLSIKMFMVATLWAISMWATEVTVTIIPALILPVLYILLGVTTPQQAFQSWSVSTIWIILGGMLICEVMNETGLMKRVAYFFIVKSGGSYRGIIIGLTLSGIIMALAIPSAVSRAVIYAGLSYGVCRSLNVKAGSRTAAGLMLGALFATAHPAYIWSTGNNMTLIAINNLANYGYNVTFTDYLIHMAPIQILWTFLIAFLLPVICKPEGPLGDTTVLKEEYQNLGKMTISEKKALFIVLIAVILVMTNSIHHIDPAWCFLVPAVICFLPFLNIADQKAITKVNYPTLIFVASCLTIGTAATAAGASTLVANIVAPLLSSGGTVTSLGITWFVAVIANFLMTPLAAVSALVAPMIEIAMQIDINPCAVVYTFIQGLEQLLFPYESAPPLIFFSFGMIAMRDFMRIFAIKGVISLAFLVTIMVPYWMFIGLL